MTYTTLTIERFAASFPERGRGLAWFFGAGTSAASGIPTGYDMILDFKTRLFCAELHLPRREVDPTDPLWRSRIEEYFDGAHGLPPLNSPGEYAAAFEAVHPTVEARRMYIDDAIRRGTASYGHRVFAALACGGLAPCIFTTNFDPLVENSIVAADDLLPASQKAHVTVAALDSADRAARALRDADWPLVVKLHGDYKSDWLLNTTTELEQDTALRRNLVTICSRFGLAVVGYSGRDQMVMASLLDAAMQAGGLPGGLLWFMRPGGSMLPAVIELLEKASAHTTATLIEVQNFDELAGELDRQVAHPRELESYVLGSRPAPRLRLCALPTDEARDFPVLRTSALSVLALPTHARRYDLNVASNTRELQGLLREHRVDGSIACQGRTVAVFGKDADLTPALQSLGAAPAEEVALDPVSDSWALGLLYDALVRALARARPLRTRMRRSGHVLVLSPPDRQRTDDLARKDRATIEPVQRAYGEAVIGTVPRLGYPYAEATRIRLEHHLDRWWVVFEPFTWVEQPRLGPDQYADPRVRDQLADWRRERWAQRYNKKWANIIDSWSKLLVPETTATLRSHGVPDGAGIDAEFSLYQSTAWSRRGRAWPTGGTT